MPYYTLFEAETGKTWPMQAPDRETAVLRHSGELGVRLTLEPQGEPARYMMCDREESCGWIHATIPVYELRDG